MGESLLTAVLNASCISVGLIDGSHFRQSVPVSAGLSTKGNEELLAARTIMNLNEKVRG